MTHFTAVLLDLDGVLISSETAIVELWQRVLSGLGVSASDDDLRHRVIGCAPEHTVEHFLGAHPAAAREAALIEVASAEESLEFAVVPGASALIAALVRAGIPVGCVTGASGARLSRALASLSAQSSLAVSVVWGDVEHGKPAGDSYVLAAERLGIPPEQCLVVEDSVGGVTAAVTAGCSCIAVASGDNAELLDMAGATAVVESLLSLTLAVSHDNGHVIATDEGDFYFPPPSAPTGD